MEIESQDLLEDLAMDNKDRFVRTIAVSRITDPNILEELAYNAKYTDVKFDKKGKNRLSAVS